MADKRPDAKFRIGLVTATVWRNENSYSVVLRRSYKDDRGEWKESDQLFAADLLNAAKVLQRAEEYISSQ
jgi:hypothetical protein